MSTLTDKTTGDFDSLTFEFAKATDITDFAKQYNEHLYQDYAKIFITPDVTDYHILRVLEGFDTDYERDPNSWLVEWNRIAKQRKGSTIVLQRDLEKVLDEDDGSNWDYSAFETLEDCLNEIDGGFGFT